MQRHNATDNNQFVLVIYFVRVFKINEINCEQIVCDRNKIKILMKVSFSKKSIFRKNNLFPG